MQINAVRLFEDLLGEAINLNASDIHIEPKESSLIIRYRVDGVLLSGTTLDLKAHTMLVARIKVLAGLDTSQNRLPQDGRFTNNSYDLRVSTMATIWGEKVVLRILNKQSLLLSLTELGMTAADLQRYLNVIKLQQGLILVTGPTGSGKTTSLYSTLSELCSDQKNIITIEDPVEYQIPEINQTQINEKAGLTFPVVLRSILRQDPDIVMIGEIRDLDTAQIAIRAALTGHLVFSTLHTSSAAGTVVRLVDMGIPAYLVAAALKGVVAQRLVRKPKGGRQGIFELLQVSDKLQDFIKDHKSEKEIESLAVKEGMVPLFEQIKVINEGGF